MTAPSEIITNGQTGSSEAIQSTIDAAADTMQSCGFSLLDMQGMTSDIITLMGASFILGSFVTTFCLLVLDFIRRNHPDE